MRAVRLGLGAGLYGWHIVVSDTLSVALAVTGVGVVTYLAVPPVLHVVHGNVGRALLSFGMRATLPPLGALAFCSAMSACRNPLDSTLAVIAGALIGVTVASAADAASAWEDASPKVPPKPRTASAAFHPMLAFEGSKLQLGVVGAF